MSKMDASWSALPSVANARLGEAGVAGGEAAGAAAAGGGLSAAAVAGPSAGVVEGEADAADGASFTWGSASRPRGISAAQQGTRGRCAGGGAMAPSVAGKRSQPVRKHRG